MNINNNFREGFMFYKGYHDSCLYLNDNEQLIYLLSIIKIGLYDSPAESKEEKLADFEANFFQVIETCKASNNVLAILMSNRANLKKTYEKYLNGCKGGEYGKLGGAPFGNKNACKNNPETTPKEKENKNINININKNENINKNNNIEEDIDYIGYSKGIDTLSEKESSFITTIPKEFYYLGSYKNVIIPYETLDKIIQTVRKKFISYDENFEYSIIKQIAEELSINIETGKAPCFDKNNPYQHFELLGKYLGQKCKQEFVHRFIKEVKQEQGLVSLSIKY